MTCIAYRDGIMAADSDMIIGGVKSPCSKIAKKNGFLVGLCGSDCPPLDEFLAAFGDQDDEARRLMKEFNFIALVVTPQGEMQLWNNKMVFEPLKTEFYAIGSGGEVALGAMDAGASATRAVKAARRWVDSVGGRIVRRKL